jgi:hypothetical protein
MVKKFNLIEDAKLGIRIAAVPIIVAFLLYSTLGFLVGLGLSTKVALFGGMLAFIPLYGYLGKNFMGLR